MFNGHLSSHRSPCRPGRRVFAKMPTKPSNITPNDHEHHDACTPGIGLSDRHSGSSGSNSQRGSIPVLLDLRPTRTSTASKTSGALLPRTVYHANEALESPQQGLAASTSQVIAHKRSRDTRARTQATRVVLQKKACGQHDDEV